jgi:hypothetical protein
MAAKNDKARIVEKYGAALAPGEPIECAADEVAVVLKWGAMQGALGPGRHAAAGDGAEVFFVRTSPTSGLRGGGSAGEVIDPPSQVPVTIRAIFEYVLRVRDPGKLVMSIAGNASDDADEGIRQWTSSRLLGAVKEAVAMTTSVMRTLGRPMDMADAILAATRGALEPMGLEVAQLGSLMLSVSEEDKENLKAAATKAAMAKLPQQPQQPYPQQPSSQAQTAPLGVGARVLVPWPDGNRYPGTIRRFENGYFEIVWNNDAAPVWLLPHQVLPA